METAQRLPAELTAALAADLFHNDFHKRKSSQDTILSTSILPDPCRDSVAATSVSALASTQARGDDARPTSQGLLVRHTQVVAHTHSRAAPTLATEQAGALDVSRATEHNQLAGKKFCPPKHYELYKLIPQLLNKSYKAVATFSYACFFLVRGKFLVWDDGTDMRPVLAAVNKEWHSMVTNVIGLRDYDFSWLAEPRFGYAEQESIPNERIKAMTASAIHYGGDTGLVARFLHREYLSTWRDTEAILAEARPYVKPNILTDMERILTMG